MIIRSKRLIERGKQPWRSRTRVTAGFTLMELIVVIAVIAILAAITMKYTNPSAKPGDAMGVASRMVEISRSEARAAETPARVAICVDPAAGERYLRYVVNLKREDEDTNSNGVLDTGEDTNNNEVLDEGWRFSGRGRTLPMGTAFYQAFSSPADAANTMRMNLATPMAFQDGTTGKTCIYIEFNSFGEPVDDSVGMQWVFTRAVLATGSSSPIVPNPLDREGFVLRQTGRVVFFQSPGDIVAPAP